MAKQRQKRRKKKRGKGGGAPAARTGGGVMQSMVRGFRRAAGAEKPASRKSSWISNILWFLLLAGAIAFAVSRWTR